MNKQDDSPLYKDFTEGADRRQFLKKVLADYRDLDNFKKEFIAFILENNFEEFLDQKIIIAEHCNEIILKLTGVPSIRTERELESLKKVFKNLYSSFLTQNISETKIPPALFYKRGDIVAVVSSVNRAMKEEEVENLLFDHESFNSEVSERVHIYKARKSGYLTLCENKFIILSPVKVSADKGSVDVIYFPVIYQANELFHFIYDWLGEFSSKYPDAPFKKIPDRKELEKSKALFFTAIEGKKAVDGRKALLEIIAVLLPPSIGIKSQADYKSFKKYTVVKKDQPLMRKIRMTTPVPGIDIYGNDIIPSEGEDIEIITGENIREEVSDEEIEYYSETDGLFVFKDNKAAVEEILIVNHNVDYKTGNIDFPKNVNIQGNVMSGFCVKSDKNVIVDGCLENGSSVECSGDLIIGKGIIGEATRVKCRGNVHVNYFSDAELYCLGNTVIERSMLGGTVFSEKSLEVLGNGIKNPSISSTYGGKYYSMGKISLHSVGNSNRKTLLCCGYNPYLDCRSRETAKARAAVEIEISRIMDSLRKKFGMTLDLKRAGEFSSDQKKELQGKLKKLKQLSESREELENIEKNIADSIYAEEGGNLVITIKKHITAVVSVQFLHDTQTISSNTGPAVLTP